MHEKDENEFWGCRRKTTDDDDGFHRDAFEWFCNCAESSESARERDYRCGRSFNERNIGDDKRVGDLTERVPRDERRTKSNSDDEFKAGRREDYERGKGFRERVTVRGGIRERESGRRGDGERAGVFLPRRRRVFVAHRIVSGEGGGRRRRFVFFFFFGG